MNDSSPHVGLFVTCLVNLFRPSVGFSTIQLLEQAGCRVSIPETQTCCGQPGYNPGDYESARQIALQVANTFSSFDYVVVPSGSCAGMLRHHYPTLFEHEPESLKSIQALADKTWELTSFLTDVLKYQPDRIHSLNGKRVTYHDSCAGLRELNIKQQPRQLLKSCNNIDIDELKFTEECCGFGGTFCAKMPDISGAMVTDKLDAALDTGADLLLGGDMGCLLNIAGRASRLGKTMEVRHVAEVLAAEMEQPGIGEGDER